jgi:outer membrane protein OmpA-like peptidoglycan-associated protein
MDELDNKETHWMSLSDLMSALMIVFLFISISYMSAIQKQQEKRNKTITDYVEIKKDIYLTLENEFKDDFKRWNAYFDEAKLSITFREPDVYFRTGSYEVSAKFKQILDDFFPRYIKALMSQKYKDHISEVRIEGHTSSFWRQNTSVHEAYFRNMELSQARTRSVLEYVSTLPSIQPHFDWVVSKITANGLSYSKIEIDKATVKEDYAKSQRVEFRVRTNTEENMETLAKDL